MRTLLNASRRQNSFHTFLVDEHRTSCRCLGCEGGINENFTVRPNPKLGALHRKVAVILNTKNEEPQYIFIDTYSSTQIEDKAVYYYVYVAVFQKPRYVH